jgi:hypothetical protein
MPPTFEKLLAELIKRAASPDDPIRCEFRDGDIAHLKRWLDSGEANKLWREITNNEPFNSGGAFQFVMYNLKARRAAEEADKLNREIPLLKRRLKHRAAKVRKLAKKRLVENKITPEQYAAFAGRAEQARRPGLSDPVLSGRSDRDGARKRVIFCRVLKDLVHDIAGQWHDRVVEALCHIALGGEVDARSARRESTRKRYR